MRIWKFLTTIALISLFPLLVFAQKVVSLSVGKDKNYYKIFITFDGKPHFKVFKDPKRDLITLKLKNDYRFNREFYSVQIVGEKDLITIFVRNPQLSTAKVKVVRKYRALVVLLPFKHKKFFKYTVVIDPGHGGKDSGATYFGIKEKDINFAVALKLYKLLKEDGRFKVYLTRKGDYFVSLAQRQKFTAQVGTDLFISIHSNANPYKPYRRGVEFYVLSNKGKYRKFIDLATHPSKALNFLDDDMVRDSAVRKKVLKTTLEFTQEEGEEFAKIARRYWCKYLARFIPCGGIYRRSFAVLKVPGVPTVLVEIGYMTNRRELNILTNPRYQWSIAKTLYRAILDYFNLKMWKN